MNLNNRAGQPYSPIKQTREQQAINVNLDPRHDRKEAEIEIDDQDPLLKLIPQDLWSYIKLPEENINIMYVSRGICYTIVHGMLAVLSPLLCCYGACRTIIVKEGEIALTQNEQQPEILGPGVHTMLSPFNRFLRIHNETEAVIDHGPIKIIKVQAGELGYGVDMETGRPILLARGMHLINSYYFRWHRFITLLEPRTILENLEIIRVETGHVAYIFKEGGHLKTFEPGLHLFQPPDRFGGIITTQMTILDLPVQVHETSDYVPLEIKAAVFYRIKDPMKALERIKNIGQQIKDTSIATLAGIIRGSSLSDVASRSMPFYHSKDDDGDENKNELEVEVQVVAGSGSGSGSGAPSAPTFFQHVHDEFVSQLHDHVLEEWGVEIQNIRIEDLRIAEKGLQNDISQQAVEVIKIHNQYLMLQKKQDIAVVEAETRALRIRIDADADALKVRTDAKAEAEAILIKARADKDALQLRGTGEAEYARLVESTKLGDKLAQMRVQVDAISGIRQIAYVPHLPTMLDKNGVFADGNVIMPMMQR